MILSRRKVVAYFQVSQNALYTESVTTLRKGLEAGGQAGYSLIGLGGVFCVEHLYYQSWWIAAAGAACAVLGKSWASSTQLAIRTLGPAPDTNLADALQSESKPMIAEPSNDLK
jgi:hypothetical protein